MASQVDIANLALTKLGAGRITSFADNSKAAKALSAVYDIILDAELRSHIWNFAKKRTSLAALADAPAWGFAYQYQLPSDCLLVFQVNDYFTHVPGWADYITADDQPFQIEGRTIHSDLVAPLKIRYVYRCTDPTQFDAMFIEALACKLAVAVCEDLTQSTTKQNTVLGDYDRAIAKARSTNAIEEPPSQQPDNTWILSRL